MYIGLLVCLVHRSGESYYTRRAKPRVEWLRYKVYKVLPYVVTIPRIVMSRGGLREARSAAQIACLPQDDHFFATDSRHDGSSRAVLY